MIATIVSILAMAVQSMAKEGGLRQWSLLPHGVVKLQLADERLELRCKQMHIICSLSIIANRFWSRRLLRLHCPLRQCTHFSGGVFC